MTTRPCTCHPDDRPDGPCPKRYAASECNEAAAERRDAYASMRKPAILLVVGLFAVGMAFAPGGNELAGLAGLGFLLYALLGD